MIGSIFVIIAVLLGIAALSLKVLGWLFIIGLLFAMVGLGMLIF